MGWLLLVLGPCLSAAMGMIAFHFSDTIYHQNHFGGGSRWHGGPKFTLLVFELLGAVFLLGIAFFVGGIYQVRTGRRSPVLVGFVLLLAAVTAYLVYGVIMVPSPLV